MRFSLRHFTSTKMEFPSLGKNCSESSCKQLDFLPMKCDACAKIYCGDHIHYNTHNCTESYKRDNQVPVCPLCNKPIPVPAGESADVKVGQHIDSDCQSDPAKERRGKIYTNKCSYKGCKQKELIPVKCDKCQLNFCLKHRHETDHSCNGFQSSGRGLTNSGAAAFVRAQTNKPSTSSSDPKSSAPRAQPKQTTLSSYLGADLNRARQARQAAQTAPAQSPQTLQNGLSEDEAMARAIEMSLAQSQSANQAQRPLSRQEREDQELAQALAASEQEARTQRRRRQQQAQQQKSSCQVS